MSAADASLCGEVFFLDGFAQRQWDNPDYSGAIISFDKAEFTKKIHEFHASGDYPLVDGYAPFCKHLFVPNFAGAKTSTLKITEENKKNLCSGYSARIPAELPVLTRWFPMEAVGEPPESKMLDIILYSREQLIKENQAMDAKHAAEPILPDAPWGIISIKAQDAAYELPMQPITMMRNSMIEEGGSGVRVDRAQYDASVAYWQDHAPIIKGQPNGD